MISLAVIVVSRLKAAVMWPPPVFRRTAPANPKRELTLSRPTNPVTVMVAKILAARRAHRARGVVVQVDSQHGRLRAARNCENPRQRDNASKAVLGATPNLISVSQLIYNVR